MCRNIFISLITLLSIVFTGNVYAKSEREAPIQVEAVSEKSVNVLKEAMNIIKNEYVTKVDEDRLVENAVNGMLASLDPHSGFYTKEAISEGALYTSEVESGIGVEITVDNGAIRVVTPVDGGPAEKSGIKAGDYIMAIDDTSVYGMSTYDVMQRIAGKPNSKIKITIFRDGVSPSMEFMLKREGVISHPTLLDYVDDEILYIRISSFDMNTYSSIERKLGRFMKKNNHKGIILDLRNNPGGLISEAVRIASMFLEKGTVVYTRGRDETSVSEYNVDSDALKVIDVPIVVLINNGTASASEIVAGALQDNRKGVIIGTRSFGKGSVQDIIPLEGESAVSLTTSLYYTPSGKSIQAEGVVPDIVIEDIEVKKYKEDHSFREENIEGHLESVKDINQSRSSYVVEKIKKRMNYNQNKHCKKCKNDYMIIRAVDLIKGISIYKTAIGEDK